MSSHQNDRDKIAMMVHGITGLGNVNPQVTITEPFEAFGRITFSTRSVALFPIPAADYLNGNWALSGIQLEYRTSDTGNISEVQIFRTDLIWEEKDLNLQSKGWTLWDAEISGRKSGFIDVAPFCVKLVVNGSASDDFVDIAKVVCTFRLLQ